VARIAIAGIPLLLVPAFGVFQGGFRPSTWVWGAALAAWAVALAVVVSGRGGALRATWRWPAIGGALLLWTLASALWSAEPHQSVLEARRTLVYAAVALALVVLARSNATRTLVAATHVAITALLTYALVRYLFGARPLRAFEGYAITQPLGYANAVGILAAMGILLALMAASDRRAALRAWGAATVPVLALTLTFSKSYASWLALGLGTFVVWLLTPRRRLVLRTCVLLAVPSLPLIWLGRYSHYADYTSPRIGGTTLAAAAAAAAIAAGILAAVAGAPLTSPRALRRPGALAVAITLAVVVAAAVGVAAGGSRQPRSSYYHVAWHEYLAHPLLGSGAGTFGHYWLGSGLVTRWGGALDAHSLYLETLAELGPVGLLLVVAFLLYPLRRAVATRNTPGVPVACGASVAFLVHLGLDWDWEMPVVVVAGLACLAAVLLADNPPSDRRLGSVAGSESSAEPSAALGNGAPQSEAPAEIT
jgi:O-antigen ligase